jgi:hypothetical protein
MASESDDPVVTSFLFEQPFGKLDLDDIRATFSRTPESSAHP